MGFYFSKFKFIFLFFFLSFTCIAEDRDPNEESSIKEGALSDRFNNEKENMFNPFVITPYEMNYILPVLYTNKLNRDPYSGSEWNSGLKDTEAKYQISFKVPLSSKSLFFDNDRLYMAFTLKSWWQVYADDISSPFRETNYQPELFYFSPLSSQFYGYNLYVSGGIKHSSNGRGGQLSRSWNYVYGKMIAEKGNLAFRINSWARLNESAENDDNPDLIDYMGNVELGMAYKWKELEFSVIGRNNFSKHHGFVEAGMTFPLFLHLKGYFQYSNGYGESLIDYNHSQQRFGIGLALTDIF